MEYLTHDLTVELTRCQEEYDFVFPNWNLAIIPKRLNDAYEMEELVDDIKFNLYKNTNRNSQTVKAVITRFIVYDQHILENWVIDVHNRSVW
jgi:hypothetical protein